MANWPNASINDGYTIVNSALTGTAESKISCWLEYKIVSQSITKIPEISPVTIWGGWGASR